MSDLKIKFYYSLQDTRDLPVKVEIFNPKLELVDQAWIKADQTAHFSVSAGIYGIRALLPSGQSLQEVKEVGPNEIKEVYLELGSLSPHENHEWAYLVRSMSPRSDQFLHGKKYAGAWMRFWRKKGGQWKLEPVPIQVNSQWDRDGVNYSFKVPKGLHALQVGGPKIPWKMIYLPPYSNLKCLVRPASGPSSVVHPLDITVNSENLKTETLLSFLTSGAMDRAHDMLEHDHEAEMLLFHKLQDPASAAVGGYYLLRVGALERMHSWAQNLANWMDWMPDGAVIRAWQIIKEARENKSKKLNRKDIRMYLLAAVNRGIPVYSEGLRLLYDGLQLLSRESEGIDLQVAKALDFVTKVMEAADWSATTTSFYGITPEKPDSKSRKGTPRSREHLVFIYDVPLKEMIREGTIVPGTELVLESELPSFKITSEGKLLSSEGSEFGSLNEAALAVTNGLTNGWWVWREANTDQYLEEITQSLRGKKIS